MRGESLRIVHKSQIRKYNPLETNNGIFPGQGPQINPASWFCQGWICICSSPYRPVQSLDTGWGFQQYHLVGLGLTHTTRYNHQVDNSWLQINGWPHLGGHSTHIQEHFICQEFFMFDYQLKKSFVKHSDVIFYLLAWSWLSNTTVLKKYSVL